MNKVIYIVIGLIFICLAIFLQIKKTSIKSDISRLERDYYLSIEYNNQKDYLEINYKKIIDSLDLRETFLFNSMFILLKGYSTIILLEDLNDKTLKDSISYLGSNIEKLRNQNINIIKELSEYRSKLSNELKKLEFKAPQDLRQKVITFRILFFVCLIMAYITFVYIKNKKIPVKYPVYSLNSIQKKKAEGLIPKEEPKTQPELKKGLKVSYKGEDMIVDKVTPDVVIVYSEEGNSIQDALYVPKEEIGTELLPREEEPVETLKTPPDETTDKKSGNTSKSTRELSLSNSARNMTALKWAIKRALRENREKQSQS